MNAPTTIITTTPSRTNATIAATEEESMEEESVQGTQVTD